MTRKEKIEERAWELIGAAAKEKGYRPVDVEYLREGGNFILRTAIDKEGGVTIDDCEVMSHAIEPILDEAGIIDGAYTMEVTSPGLGRKLRRPHDFEYGKGREIDVRTYRPFLGKKEFTGILTDFTKDAITVETADGTVTVPKTETSLIRLTYDF